MTISLMTFDDAVQEALDYRGLDGSDVGTRTARRAVRKAYNVVTGGFDWSYYMKVGQIVTQASYTTGTVTYDHTGGTYERQVTLAGGTWPSWAGLGVLRIGDVPYIVDERKSDAVLTLITNNNPGADVAATAYTLAQDTYPLPTDAQAVGQLVNLNNDSRLAYVAPQEWVEMRRSLVGPGVPYNYTLSGSPDYFGEKAVRLYPAPDSAYTIQFAYKRWPRPLALAEEKRGAVSVTSGSAVVTGAGTVFTSRMVGSVIRVSATGADYPTDYDGDNPYRFERMVVGYTSPTSITVDANFDETLTGVKYLISDPLDLDVRVMGEYFQREVENQIRLSRRVSEVSRNERDQLVRAMFQAQEMDASSFQRRSAGGVSWHPIRLADMPEAD